MPLLCEKLREVLADVSAPARKREAKKQQASIRRRRELEAAKARLVSLFVEGQITQGDYQARADDLAAQLARLEEPEGEEREVSVEDVRKLLRVLERAWPEMTVEEQRGLLLGTVKRIIPNPDAPQQSQVVWQFGV